MEGFGREVVVFHNFAADEAFEGEGGEHVEAETAESDVSIILYLEKWAG
jgi:hypothetical protein